MFLVNKMAVMLCAAMAIGVAAACVAPIYYFKETAKSADNDDIVRPRIVVSQHESAAESPQFQIQIRQPRGGKIVKAVSPRLRDKTAEEESEEKSEDDKCEKSAKPESSPCDCQAPLSRSTTTTTTTTTAKSSGDRRRRLGNLLPWRRHRRTHQAPNNNNTDRNDTSKGTSPNKTGMFFHKDNTSVGGISSSSETGNCGVTEVVTVQIEAPPEHRAPSTPRASPPETPHAGEPTSQKSSSMHNLTPLTKILFSKWKTFKRSLHRNKMRDTSSFKDMAEGRSTCQTPVGHSTVLPKRRVIDEQTNVHDMSSDSKRVNYLLLNNTQNPKEGLKIIGLRVSQAELLSGTNDGHNTAILMAEEESIVSIGFHNDRHGQQQNFPASTECLMQKFYRSLPVKFERSSIPSFFGAQRRSRSRSFDGGQETRRNVDSGISNDSSDETSYVSFSPKRGKNQVNGKLENNSRTQVQN